MSDTRGANTPFAERLHWLMQQHRQPNGQAWTAADVSRALKARGYPVSRQHLWKLLHGGAQPSFALVDALAALFGVGLDEFSSERVEGDEEQQLPAVLYRAGELPPAKLSALASYIQFLESQHADPDTK